LSCFRGKKQQRILHSFCEVLCAKKLKNEMKCRSKTEKHNSYNKKIIAYMIKSVSNNAYIANKNR